MKERSKKKVRIRVRSLLVSSGLVVSVVDNLQTRLKQAVKDRIAEQREAKRATELQTRTED